MLAYDVGRVTSAVASPMAYGEHCHPDALAALKLPRVSAANLKMEVEAAMAAAQQISDKILGKVAARIHRMADQVNDKMPPYEEYTVKEFDTDKVKTELVDKDWEWFAAEWVFRWKLLACANVAGQLSHCIN